MDWRDFVHDHAIKIFLTIVGIFLFIAFVAGISILARRHKLKVAFTVLVCIALLLSMAIIPLSAGLVNSSFITHRDNTLVGFGLALFMIVLLIWLVSIRWVDSIDKERIAAEEKFEAAKKQLTLRVVNDKP